MTEKFFEILTKNINYILNINDNVKTFGNFFVKQNIDKYSSIKSYSLGLFLDDIKISTNKYKISYNCPNCNKTYLILLKKFLLKKSYDCISCKENEIKSKNHSICMKNYVKKDEKYIVKENKIEFINNSNNSFNNETNYFKEKYYKNHLTNEDFENLSDNILYINNLKYDKNIVFYEHLKTNNQIKYSQYVFINESFINIKNVIFKCCNCEKSFKTSRKLKDKLNKQILCKDCCLSNKTFSFKNFKNVNNKNVIYQSNLELKLLQCCNNNNIIIENGPKIKYFFQNKILNYKIDFFISKLNLLIEIKDNHIWHKKQVESGKWLAKENAAIEYSKLNNLQFKLIFSQYLEDFLKTLY